MIQQSTHFHKVDAKLVVSETDHDDYESTYTLVMRNNNLSEERLRITEPQAKVFAEMLGIDMPEL